MVVVDYSVNDGSRRNDYHQEDDRQQLVMDAEAAVSISIANFCPRLRQSLSLLARHKVGPLQQLVYLSDFQSSTTSSLSTDGSISSTQPPCYDRFVLALPYFYEEVSVVSGPSFVVRWSIIAQCGHPDKAPEVILLEMDESSIVSRFKEEAMCQSLGNQQPQYTRHQYQTHQIFQEHFWQQYVASDIFNMQCLTKWGKVNNENSYLLQYCILADQLYECYAHFQFYKLKMSLKPTPSIIQSPSHLIQAYTQYKQLTKLSTSIMLELDSARSEISVELFIDLEGGININDYEVRRKLIISSAVVYIRAIISIVSFDQTASAAQKSTKTTGHNNDEKVPLVSVTATFAPNSTSGSTSNKNTTVLCNTKSNLKKKYLVRILNAKLARSTYQGAMMSMMLNATTEQSLDTTIIDFVLYVRRVQHAAVQSYNSNEVKLSFDDYNDNSIQLLLEALYETFCDSPSRGNYLLDYQISNDSLNNQNNTSFIRFLLTDEDIATETTQLKYVLTIEYNKEVYEEFKNIKNKGDQIIITKLVPIIALRSVYDDENSEHFLNIDISDIIDETDKNNMKYNNELASIIKTATVNGMRKLRQKVLTPILTRYHQQWCPTDPYFASSLSCPPPYLSP